MPGFGTDAQESFARKLITQLGMTETLQDAASLALGKEIGKDQLPISKAEASKVITWLESKLPPGSPMRSTRDGASTAGKSDAAHTRIFTARQLRRIALHEDPYPLDLDEDARWVLIRLQRLEGIAAMAAGARGDQQLAVNGDEPIKTESLRHYFGSDEVAAEAFGISVGTFRAWGTHVPPQQQWRAECQTNGYVRVPRKTKL